MLFFTPVFLAGGATFDLKFRDRTSDMTTKFSGSGAVLVADLIPLSWAPIARGSAAWPCFIEPT